MFCLDDERTHVPPDTIDTQECVSCHRSLPLICFRRDASYSKGRYVQCEECEAAPRLSTSEHVQRLRERNSKSWALKQQKWAHQDDYRNAVARWGRVLHHSEFLRRLTPMLRDVFIRDGNVVGDLAVYRVYGRPQPHLDGKDFSYLFYMPTGVLPEFSIYKFDDRDVIVGEERRGWRTILLRLIKAGIITEAQSDAAFGEAQGEASTVWRRQMYITRNGVDPDPIF